LTVARAKQYAERRAVLLRQLILLLHERQAKNFAVITNDGRILINAQSDGHKKLDRIPASQVRIRPSESPVLDELTVSGDAERVTSTRLKPVMLTPP